MKTRRTKVDEQGTKHIVWFGSYGVNADGTAKFFNPNDKNDNYSENAEAVVDSLTQQLSVLKGELWYNMSIGLPLFDKYRSRGTIDAYVASVISKHPDVKDIVLFKSELNGSRYSNTFTCITKYSDITVEI